jgi:hypothetical protein
LSDDLSPEGLAEILAPLPADARMDAYYYGFDRTEVGVIDAVLSAVAKAGKGYHHTEEWNDEHGDGLPSHAARIQLSAESAADVISVLVAEVERLRTLVSAQESALNFETTCLNCADRLQDGYDAWHAGYEKASAEAGRYRSVGYIDRSDVRRIPMTDSDGRLVFIGMQPADVLAPAEVFVRDSPRVEDITGLHAGAGTLDEVMDDIRGPRDGGDS